MRDATGMDVFESSHRETMAKFERDSQSSRLESYLSTKLNRMMIPLSNKVLRMTRLVDQIIINVDKHEDQVDIIEQALFGKSRAQAQDEAREETR